MTLRTTRWMLRSWAQADHQRRDHSSSPRANRSVPPFDLYLHCASRRSTDENGDALSLSTRNRTRRRFGVISCRIRKRLVSLSRSRSSTTASTSRSEAGTGNYILIPRSTWYPIIRAPHLAIVQRSISRFIIRKYHDGRRAVRASARHDRSATLKTAKWSSEGS